MIKHHRGLALLLLLCAAGAGCEGDQPREDVAGELRVERFEIGDTTIIRTLSGSVWRDTMMLVPEEAIGSYDGENAYIFGSIRGLDVDAEGRIFVVDGQARELRIFSADGDHQQTIGRMGAGPGEFQRPDHVRLARDGRIIVRDAPLRFSVFTPEGVYLNSWSLGAGFSTNAPFYLDVNDRILNPTMPDRLVWYDLDGTSADTIPVPSRGYEAPRIQVASESGRATYTLPFVPNEWWAMTRNGSLLSGLNETYALDRTDQHGNVLRIERHVDAVPVAEGEAEQAREGVTGSARSMDPDWRWSGPDVPSSKPAYRSAIPGVDETIWVLRTTRAEEVANPYYDPARDAGNATFWREAAVADVFDAEGRYLGPVKLPEGLDLFTAPALSENLVVGVATHPDGYQQVVRYRLEAAGNPSTGRP